MAGANRNANRKLARAAHGTRQKEVGHIRTRNQQQETDTGEKHYQQWLDVADDILRHGNQSDAGLFIRHRKGDREIVRNDVHVRLRLPQGHARFHPADRARTHRDPAIQNRWIIPLAYGNVDITRMAVKGKARGNHSHDGVGYAVQGKRFADDIRRRAEFAFIEATAKNDYGRRSNLVVVEAEGAAQNRLNPEGGKEIRGDHVAAQPLGFGYSGQVEILVAVNMDEKVRFCRCQSRKFR